VFTDIQMPGSMDGLALANIIKDRWPPIALLLTSGYVKPLAHELPDKARFLKKPYIIGHLKKHFEALMG
jgi:two-component system, response regulator PdtaR